MKVKEELKIIAESKKMGIPYPEMAFFFLLAMPFIKYSLVLTGAALIGIPIAFYGLFISQKYKIDNYLIWVVGFYLIGELLALFSTPDLGRTMRYSIEKLLVLLVLYPIMKNTITSNEKQTCIANVYKMGCLISALFVWISSIAHIRIGFISDAFQTHRLIFAGYGPNVSTRLFCIGSLIALYEAQKNSGKQMVLNYLEYILISFAAISTVSMSGLIIFAVGSVGTFLMFNRGVKRYGVIKIIIVTAFIVCVVVLAYHKVEIITQIINKFLYRLNANQDDISNGRLEVLSDFWSHFSNHWMVGIGYGCSYHLVGRTIHFPIIASLVEIGIFGFASVLIQYGYPIVNLIAYHNSNKKLDFFSFLSIMIIIGDMIQPNPNYLFTWFAIFLGMIRVNNAQNRKHSDAKNIVEDIAHE